MFFDRTPEGKCQNRMFLDRTPEGKCQFGVDHGEETDFSFSHLATAKITVLLMCLNLNLVVPSLAVGLFAIRP